MIEEPEKDHRQEGSKPLFGSYPSRGRKIIPALSSAANRANGSLFAVGPKPVNALRGQAEPGCGLPDRGAAIDQFQGLCGFGLLASAVLVFHVNSTEKIDGLILLCFVGNKTC